MPPKFISRPILLCLLLIMSSFAQVVIGNGSCQMYGHSCLGGHGKRSSSPEMDNSPAQPKMEAIEMVKPGNPEIDAVANDIDSAQLIYQSRVNAIKNNLARQLRRIEQYRVWKRVESLLNSVGQTGDAQRSPFGYAELKKLQDDPSNLDSFMK